VGAEDFLRAVAANGLLLVLVGALKERGYRIAKARSGEEAEKIVQNTRVDMVFIEVTMPVMKGLEIYKALRKIRSDVKVVMTTNYREGIEDLIDQAISESAYVVRKVITLLQRILFGKTKAEIPQMEGEDDSKGKAQDAHDLL